MRAKQDTVLHGGSGVAKSYDLDSPYYKILHFSKVVGFSWMWSHEHNYNYVKINHLSNISDIAILRYDQITSLISCMYTLLIAKIYICNYGWCICSEQFVNLRNFEIAPRKLEISNLRNHL